MKEAVEAINAHRGNQVKAALSLRLSRQALQARLHLAKERGLKIEAKPTAPIPEPVKPFAAENAPPPSYTGGHIVELVSNKDNTFLFGAAGDLHAASKYTRWDVREELYEWFANEGASCNFDTGNWIDGDANFNRYDLEVSGLDRQIKLLAKRHPRNIPTYAVWGDDHEGWYVQREGVDVGAYAEHVMQEAGHKWVNLGFMEASVALKNKNSGKVATMAVVHPGGGCFTEGAEILTRTRGWVDFKELSLFDEVATLNKTSHAFEWQRPVALTNQPYSGDVITFKNRVLHCTVTPEHRFMVRNYAAHLRSEARNVANMSHPQKSHPRVCPDWQILTAAEIEGKYCRQRWAFPTTCANWVGELTPLVHIPHRAPKKYASAPINQIGPFNIYDAAELIGWYASEGSIHGTRKQFLISQEKSVNPYNHYEICSLFERLGVKFRAFERGVSCCSVILSEWLEAQCGAGSRHKRIPEWLKNQPKDVLECVLTGLIFGDGWLNGTSFCFKTISCRLADDICEIAQKCGFGITSHKSGEEITIGIRVVQNTPTLNEPPVRSSYNGNIYCCTVPNGMIYVRMNGKAFWSHNSAYAISYSIQKIIESLDGGEKPAIGIYGHYHKLWSGLIRNVWVAQTGCQQDQTPFMRKKRLEAHVGGCLIKLTQDPKTGAITRMQCEIARYFNRGYYSGRWSKHGDVVLPKRSKW
jgi:hypothetical protein